MSNITVENQVVFVLLTILSSPRSMQSEERNQKFNFNLLNLILYYPMNSIGMTGGTSVSSITTG